MFINLKSKWLLYLFCTLFGLLSFLSCSKKATPVSEEANAEPSVEAVAVGESEVSVDDGGVVSGEENGGATGAGSTAEFEVEEAESESKVDLSGMTMAEQIKYQLNKKVEEQQPVEFSEKESTQTVMEEPIGTQSQFTTNNGKVVKRKRIGVKSSSRKDNEFSFKSLNKPQIPADYRIGVLADVSSNDYRLKKVTEVIEGFVTTLSQEKRVDEKYFTPDSIELIKNNMSYFIDSGALPDPLFRIGKLAADNKRVRVNVRFYLNNGATDGEIVLEEVDKKGIRNWLISDIQVDFAKLLVPYKGFNEPFVPSSYNLFDWE